MVKIEVCLGSSCYARGANEALDSISRMIEMNGWQDQVELKGMFCRKLCQAGDGLGIRINGRPLTGITPQNVTARIHQEIEAVLA